MKIAELMGGMSHDKLTRPIYDERWTASAIIRCFDFLAIACAEYWAAKAGSSQAGVKDWASRLMLIGDGDDEIHLTCIRLLSAESLKELGAVKKIVRSELPHVIQFRS